MSSGSARWHDLLLDPTGDVAPSVADVAADLDEGRSSSLVAPVGQRADRDAEHLGDLLRPQQPVLGAAGREMAAKRRDRA